MSLSVSGKEEKHSEGAYYLEWRENGRRVRLSVGKDPSDASARRQRKEAALNALNNGVSDRARQRGEWAPVDRDRSC